MLCHCQFLSKLICSYLISRIKKSTNQNLLLKISLISLKSRILSKRYKDKSILRSYDLINISKQFLINSIIRIEEPLKTLLNTFLLTKNCDFIQKINSFVYDRQLLKKDNHSWSRSLQFKISEKMHYIHPLFKPIKLDNTCSVIAWLRIPFE